MKINEEKFWHDRASSRSSTADYLTFVASNSGEPSKIELRYQDENIWLTQKMIAELYGVSVPAINQHLRRIYSDAELTEASTIKKYLIVRKEGNREVESEGNGRFYGGGVQGRRGSNHGNGDHEGDAAHLPIFGRWAPQPEEAKGPIETDCVLREVPRVGEPQ